MNTIETSGITVVNELDVRGRAILALIAQYIPGFRGRYFGFKPTGDNDIVFPAIFVDPVDESPQLATTGKYEMKWGYDLIFFAVENNPEELATLISSCAESLVKLFSNNALTDIGSGNTGKFKAYAPFWIGSEMSGVQISKAFQNPDPNNPSLMRAGRMRLEIEDVILK